MKWIYIDVITGYILVNMISILSVFMISCFLFITLKMIKYRMFYDVLS